MRGLVKHPTKATGIHQMLTFNLISSILPTAIAAASMSSGDGNPPDLKEAASSNGLTQNADKDGPSAKPR